ncbi:MAG: hypothetical protein ACRDRV_02210 [Pseudonocardiaceae bacterium]
MNETDHTSTHGAQTELHDQPWKRRWQKIKTPLQLITAQLIGWALHKWWG